MDDGAIMHGFLMLKTPCVLHICNAPPPAATSSPAFAEYILDTHVKKH